MEPSTIGLIGITLIVGFVSFFFGALWGREQVLKTRRGYESFNPEK